MAFLTTYHTDIGLRKQTNQDALLIKTAITPQGPVGLFIICDGMGGLSHGELASATVVRSLAEWFDGELPELLKADHNESLELILEEKVRECNQKILMYGEASKIRLGTTLTAFLVVHEKYYLVQIGDSRAYTINDQLTQLTKDQTLVARELERGNITEAQAKVDKRRNVLLQCVGATENLDVVISTGEVEADTTYMLCSDGFYHKISEREIWQHLAPENLIDENQMKEKVVELVDLIKSRKEKDNITILLTKLT
ncbi:PP2C family protein-serine/threonine phosphatase [Alkalihalobacterium elongatum]|uniref:PP2C family protein-serine/threonine phosphatase n=1 Tax=Alkalihalobacterium elongatum TaxID=2675466 RepID=UPI001C1FD7C0|nr:protein phosphatase 2C domain-containing protein [Alkalihalobacterium elongatum]